MASLPTKLRHAWDAFNGKDTREPTYRTDIGPSTSSRPDRPRMIFMNDRTIISSIYSRLSIDVSEHALLHVKVDGDGRYSEDVDSGLNYCLAVEPNIDQGPRHLRQDIALTMFDRGVVAIVPVETTVNPTTTGSYDIRSIRVGTITAWYPKHVKVELYNEALGRREEIILAKKNVAIAENPLHAVMNEPLSTLKRLIRKINLLDSIDEQSASGKLDLIIQLPYTIKSELRREQAEQRKKDIEFQLKDSKYGIAYVDATEKITQLNRPAENNLMGQVEYLMKQLYAQLGLTEEIMNGTADEKAMLNYTNRTIKPVLDAIVEAMSRAFITKTARSQGHRIMYFNNPFALVPLANIAEIADKFTRNEILASNEIRPLIGFKPSKDPKADELRNSNMPAPATEPAQSPTVTAEAVDTS